MGEQFDGSELGAKLLGWVRQRTGAPVSFASAPAPLSGGYDTLIYAFELSGAPGDWAGPLVIRVFRDDQGPRRAVFEAAAQAAIAEMGYPCPRPVAVEPDPAPLGAPFIVMPRLPGRPLLSAGARTVVLRMPAILAEEHARLHELDAAAFQRALAEAGIVAGGSREGTHLAHLRDAIEAHGLAAFEPGLTWLQRNLPPPPEEVVCHLDFHPLNVMFDGRAVTGVIDWANASVGDPAADVAATLVIMEMGPLDAGWLQRPADLVRRFLAWRYFRAYQRLRPVDPARVRYYQAFRCFAAMVHATIRRAEGDAAARGGYAWDQPAQVRRMTRFFERVTGCPCPTPERAIGVRR